MGLQIIEIKLKYAIKSTINCSNYILTFLSTKLNIRYRHPITFSSQRSQDPYLHPSCRSPTRPSSHCHSHSFPPRCPRKYAPRCFLGRSFGRGAGYRFGEISILGRGELICTLGPHLNLHLIKFRLWHRQNHLYYHSGNLNLCHFANSQKISPRNTAMATEGRTHRCLFSWSISNCSGLTTSQMIFATHDFLTES